MRTRLVTKKTIVTIMCLKQTFMIDLSKVKKKKNSAEGFYLPVSFFATFGYVQPVGCLNCLDCNIIILEENID